MSANRTPKTLLLIALLALMGAAFVAGCGGSGGTTSADQNPPANPPSAAVEPKKEPAEEEAEAAEAEEAAKAEEAEGGTGEEAEGGTGEEEGSEAKEGGSEGGASLAAGMEVFTTNCGSCHTLAAAGTTGEVGPNLDELMPSESTVETQVINGGGPMPAFGNSNILTSEEIKAVAAYVSSEAGQ